MKQHSEPRLKIDQILKDGTKIINRDESVVSKMSQGSIDTKQRQTEGSKIDLSKEISKTELKNWRKKPTMKVTDMAANISKAQHENLYLAEKKFKLHNTGLSFKQIRNSLNT